MPVREKSLTAALSSLAEDFGPVSAGTKEDASGPDFGTQLGAALMANSADPAPGAGSSVTALTSAIRDKTRMRFSATSGQQMPAQARPETLALLVASVPAQVPGITAHPAPPRKLSDSSAASAARSSSAPEGRSPSTSASLPLLQAHGSAPTASNFTRELSGAKPDSRLSADSTNPRAEYQAAGSDHSAVDRNAGDALPPNASSEVARGTTAAVTIARSASPDSSNQESAQVQPDAPSAASSDRFAIVQNASHLADGIEIQASSTGAPVLSQKLAIARLAGASGSESKQTASDSRSQPAKAASGEQKTSVATGSSIQRGTSPAVNDRLTTPEPKMPTGAERISALTASDAQQTRMPIANASQTPASAKTPGASQGADPQQAPAQSRSTPGPILQSEREGGTGGEKIGVAPKANGTPQAASGPSPAADAQPRRIAAAAPVASPRENLPQSVQHTAKLTVELDGGGAAQATIRERAGAIDVKITAPGADSARHFATEVSALRRSLDDAGMTLRSAEVSYRSDGQQQSQHQESGRPRHDGRTDPKEVFLVKENKQ